MRKNSIFIALFIFLSVFLYAQKTPVPLPYLNILPQEEQYPISSQTLEIISALQTEDTKEDDNIIRPYIFSEDIARSDYQLSLIVERYFISQKWLECEIELRKFLLINRAKEITARANFYLGQTLYYSENYEKALYTFLETMDFFPAQSNLWIQSSLDNINVSTE